MGRNAARITHDEVVRMVKAVRTCGLPIARVTFDGNRVDVVIGKPESASSEPNTDLPSKEPASSGLLAEPEV